MDTDDTRGTQGNQLFDPVGIDVVGARIYVAKDWCDPTPLERMGRRDKGE
jgi:hypothetical protein